MKKLTLTTLFCFSISNVVATAPAFAGFFEDVRRGVENALPVSTRSIKCDQIRDDANHHQAEISQSRAAVHDHLKATDDDINDNNLTKQKLTEIQNQLNQYQALINSFKDINTGLVKNSAEMKNVLLTLQARQNDPAFESFIAGMESQASNPRLQKLAQHIHVLLKNNTAAVEAFLASDNSQVHLQQMAQLISGSEVIVAQQKGANAALLADNEARANYLAQEQTDLTAQINQLNSEWNSQEERKSCKF